MRLRSFTPRQPIPDVQPKAQEWKRDPEVIIKHEDLYARAWESEYETSIFDNDQHEPDSGNSPEVTVRHHIPNEQTCTFPGIIQEDSPEILPHTDEIGDGTDTDHYMEPDAEVDVEPFSPSKFNSRSTKYNLRHNPKANCNDDYRLYIANLSRYGTRNNYGYNTWILVNCYGTVTEHLRTDPQNS